MEIRNFCIISHIDHGKSTLADRFLEITKTIPKEKMREQFLDMMKLEREKGITIKLQPARMEFDLKSLNLEVPKTFDSHFVFNLVDTPGHVDFSYEVSRAMKAVEGAILLVDVKKGIQAQTLSNFLIAKKEKLKIIPVLNKVDLSVEDLEEKRKSLADLVGVSLSKVSLISSKTGFGVKELLKRIIEEIPSPPKEAEGLSALIFDSEYDSHLGVVVHIRVFGGEIRRKDVCFLYHQKEKFEVKKLGYFLPQKVEEKSLKAGEIGWIATGIKKPEKVLIGDSIVDFSDYQNKRKLFILSGFKKPNPVVFAALYPKNPDDYENLVISFKKLHLNDSSLFWQEISTTLGRGLLVGFLGLLHLEIVCARLKEEYQIKTVVTLPTVLYQIELKNGEIIEISDISKMPSMGEIKRILEPYVKLEVFLPAKFLNEVFSLQEKYRLKYLDTKNLDKDNFLIEFEAPLAEIIVDFDDVLKSKTMGFGSFSYYFLGYKESELKKLEIYVAKELQPALSFLVHKDKGYQKAKELVKKLKENLEREQFPVIIQGALDGKIVAKEILPSLKKNVTAPLYGGDFSRKKKLLVKQREGKKKLLKFGKVKISPEVFLKILSR